MRRLTLIALTVCVAGTLRAQSSGCSYRNCGLTIVPTWNGLAVDRLEQRARAVWWHNARYAR